MISTVGMFGVRRRAGQATNSLKTQHGWESSRASLLNSLSRRSTTFDTSKCKLSCSQKTQEHCPRLSFLRVDQEVKLRSFQWAQACQSEGLSPSSSLTVRESAAHAYSPSKMIRLEALMAGHGWTWLLAQTSALQGDEVHRICQVNASCTPSDGST